MKLIEFIELAGEQGISGNRIVYNKNYTVDDLITLVDAGEVFVMHNGCYVAAKFAPIHHKTKHSAGADVQCLENVTIKPGEMVCITTNLLIPEHMKMTDVVIITPRSSTWNKVGTIILVNSIGIIDADFPKNVGFQYVNIGKKAVNIAAGTDIGQAICVSAKQLWPVKHATRYDGIGSTDK